VPQRREGALKRDATNGKKGAAVLRPYKGDTGRGRFRNYGQGPAAS
jgi:hypothetical protein